MMRQKFFINLRFANIMTKTTNWQVIISKDLQKAQKILEEKKQLICLLFVTTKVLWIIT
jgi:hypothetical protein